MGKIIMTYSAHSFFSRISSVGLLSNMKAIAAALGSFVVLSLPAAASTLVLKEVGAAPFVDNPLYVTAPTGDPDRAFVVGQDGDIHIYDRTNDTVLATPFLNNPALGGIGEQGLLGLAFAPDYATSGKFYVSYVTTDGQHKVDEYMVSADPNVADAGSARNIITIDHPDDGNDSHYGGWIGFSPEDGNLYITTGDSDEFTDASQNNDNLLGSVLRIDPCSTDCDVMGRNYNIPAGNMPGGLEEIWANGLRNPYRAGFDPLTGALFIGDVGEDRFEEINIGAAGANYGWITYEGREEIRPDIVDLDESDVTFALYEYLHGTGDFEGFSVTAGGVYRGPIAELDGFYFFADFVNATIWSFEFDLDAMSISNLIQWDLDLGSLPASTFDFVTSIGFDGVGNMYFTNLFGNSTRTFLVTDAILDAEVPLPAAGLLMLAGLGLLSRKMKRR